MKFSKLFKMFRLKIEIAFRFDGSRQKNEDKNLIAQTQDTKLKKTTENYDKMVYLHLSTIIIVFSTIVLNIQNNGVWGLVRSTGQPPLPPHPLSILEIGHPISLVFSTFQMILSIFFVFYLEKIFGLKKIFNLFF